MQRTTLADGADVDVLVENLDVRVVFDIPGGVDAGLNSFQVDRLAVFAVQLQRDLLEVENDVGRIFDDARNRRELVQHAFDLHCRDGSAFDRRQQHAPQSISNRCSESALKRLRGKLSVCFRRSRFAADGQSFWFLKTLPEHCA